MTRIFYIIDRAVIMAKIIGFSEKVSENSPRFIVDNLSVLEPYDNHRYLMIHNGPCWSIGYQAEIRYFLDDGTHVDFVNDYAGQVQFLKDYIANGCNTPEPQKLEIAYEVEFMDI